MPNKPRPGKRRWHARIYQQAQRILCDRHRDEYDGLVAELRTLDPFDEAANP